ncbi:Zinc metalloproteinase nas-14 [Trichinella pseudospiralis]|uniref:Metalloendopeptidase n=1 Tax=Trichinella pseudospiralis TaxID=6337 RepID=A0A0V1KAR5_TRIPS|nr:Zinc metalloproteinase nas-14 [Trichinella pseudospiralis]
MLFQSALLFCLLSVAWFASPNDKYKSVPQEKLTRALTEDVKLYDQLNMRFKWPNGVVPFVFVSPDKWLEDCVKDAMKTIESVSCVRFIPYNATAHQSFGHLSIKQIKHGCKSHVGRAPGKASPLYLSQQCCIRKGTVLHELMHTLGFTHEHTRPDRKNYIDIDLNNVAEQHWKNFRKDKQWMKTPITTMYDYDSVMHYSPFAFSKNGNSVIRTRNNKTVGQRDQLSELDIYKINGLYRCKSYSQCHDSLELNDCIQQGLVMKKCADEEWAFTNCKETCGFCKPYLRSKSRYYYWCIDTSPMCPWWYKKGLCERNPNVQTATYQLVIEWCPRTCNKC